VMVTDGFLPLEHPPGEAQVDFGEARFIENGITYDGNYLNISYPHSNGGYMQLFKSQNQECLLEGMKAIFEYVGGVPIAIWFDNMSTAVKKVKEYGKRDLTDGFIRFMMHYGFQSNFCNPNSGNDYPDVLVIPKFLVNNAKTFYYRITNAFAIQKLRDNIIFTFTSVHKDEAANPHYFAILELLLEHHHVYLPSQERLSA